MINRSFKDSLVGGRNIPARMEHRRGLSLNGISKETDENLDLFSRNRRSLSLASSDESDVSVKLGRLSVVPAKLAKSGMDDLLSAADGGKHDYDWLLTPPGTPIFPSSDRIESQAPSAAPRSSSLARSVSTNKASRGIELPSARSRGNFPLPVKSTNLSVSQSESNHPSRPIRSNSVTRPSISTSQYNTYSNKSSSILNTSSTSVSSYIRPSSPAARSSISSSTARPSTPSSRSSMSSSTARPSTPPARSSMSSSTARPSTPSSRSSMSSSTARPSTPSARPVASRSSTPSKARPTPTTTSIERTRPSPNSRPSTPNSRPSIPANLNTPATRPASRPSTPTRRNSAPSLSPSTTHLSPETGLSISIGRMPSNGRNAATLSQPSSPSPRVRPLPQPMILPDFSLETPPNLRTTLPDRPLSAGRSRPGVALTVKGNVENPTPTNVPRRQPSPIGSRGRLSETPVKGRLHPGLQAVETVESRKASHVPELSMRKPIKPSATSTESSGFGRNISKKSLDMAIRHMDIRNGTGGVRPLSGTTRFPQSIRSANPKNQVGRALSAPAAVNGNLPISNNGYISSNGDYINRSPENGIKEENYRVSARLTEVDIYESSRYDTILLKEDLKNTNWLHSFDGKSDQGPIFDNGFEPLPEPFDPL